MTAEKGADIVRRTIERFEGRRNYAYKDSAGKWTIGVGHLIVLPQESALLKFTKENPAPDALIDTIFARDSAAAKNAVSSYVKIPLTDNQRAALVSLAFNIGPSAFRDSTLVKKLNAGDPSAANEILRWKYAGGEPILLARREQEKELFTTG